MNLTGNRRVITMFGILGTLMGLAIIHAEGTYAVALGTLASIYFGADGYAKSKGGQVNQPQ